MFADEGSRFFDPRWDASKSQKYVIKEIYLAYFGKMVCTKELCLLILMELMLMEEKIYHF